MSFKTTLVLISMICPVWSSLIHPFPIPQYLSDPAWLAWVLAFFLSGAPLLLVLAFTCLPVLPALSCLRTWRYLTQPR